ncbi:MAG: hypothetical protein GC168_01930 [Candidatus Hydrogenedens sp.]|nr:hypothetical protein [Candidatus Hydrogenedens sp.]
MKLAALLLALTLTSTVVAEEVEAIWAPVGAPLNLPVPDRQQFVEHRGGLVAISSAFTGPDAQGIRISTDGIHWNTSTTEGWWHFQYAFSAASFREKLWLIGGRYMGRATWPDGSKRENAPDQSVLCSTDGNQWDEVSLAHLPPWAGRMYAKAIAFHDKLWIIGGQGKQGELGDAWYTEDGEQWILATRQLPCLVSQEALCCVHDDRLWITGPADQVDAVWSSPDGVTWNAECEIPPWGNTKPKLLASLHGMLFCVTNDTVWVSSDGKEWHSFRNSVQAETYMTLGDRILAVASLNEGRDAGAVSQLQSEQLADSARNLENTQRASFTELSVLPWAPEELSWKLRRKLAPVVPRSVNGWQEIAPLRAGASKWSFGAIEWKETLWAFSSFGHLEFSPNGADWFPVGMTPPFVDDAQAIECEIQTAIDSNRLWVLCKKIEYTLWSTADGRRWRDESSSLPSLQGDARFVEHDDSLFLMDASSVCRLGEEGGFARVEGNVDWAPRYGYAVASHSGHLYVVGGRTEQDDRKEGSGDVWRSADGTHWEQIQDDAQFDRCANAGLVSYRDHLWLLGKKRFGTAIPDLWNSPDGMDWKRIVPLPEGIPVPFPPASATVFKNQLWLFSDRRGEGLTSFTSEGKHWRAPGNELPWRPRVAPVIRKFKDAWWLIGGSTPEEFGYGRALADVWRTEDWIEWQLITDAAEPLKSAKGQVVATGEALWIVRSRGVSQYPPFPYVWRSDDGAAWTPSTEIPPWSEIEEPNVVGFQDKVWVFGGHTPRPDGLGWQRETAIYSTSDGDHWTLAGQLPVETGDHVGFDYNPRVFDGWLWLNPDYNYTHAIWRTQDGAQWEQYKMEPPFGPYVDKHLVCTNEYMWLTGGTLNRQQQGQERRTALLHWWRTRDGASWEPLPFAAPVSFMDELKAPIMVGDGRDLYLVDTIDRRVYQWDEERARQQCFEDPNPEFRDWIDPAVR